MALIKDGKLVEDAFTPVANDAELPAADPVVVSLARWRDQRDELIARGRALGIRLRSDESPAQIAEDLPHFELVALEFPGFKDGRAYSYARLLRERYGFKGEVRAVGDVLLEQLLFMHRCGFDAFELESEHAVDDWVTATSEISVWYQPTVDGRATAMQLRQERDRG
ncbi:MAG: DUF934 domain-containing protein [Myxococcota bacterium]